jgi:Hsp20/alpha crystallin family
VEHLEPAARRVLKDDEIGHVAFVGQGAGGQEDVLTLAGKREPKTQQENVNWQRRERAYGTFSRAVQLPFRVDPDKVQARFNNGILEVELERLEADRPKKIEIRVLGWKKLGLERSLGTRLVTYADDLVILCRRGNAEAGGLRRIL